MIKSLYLDKCFTHQDVTYTFDQGMTSIAGPNESGKSLILEMIRYALFGTKARRGDADDYKKLHVELTFQIASEDYRVVRKGNRADLFKGDDKVATGTKPVNTKIVDLLGYDLTVFDVANACNQGAIEALGAMTPAQRKAMVDQTIGLTTIDEVIKQVGETANAERKAADLVEEALVEPTMPDRPDGYRPVDELENDRGELAEHASSLRNARAWLESSARQEPVEPVCDVQDSVEDLENHQQRLREVSSALDRLRGQRSGLRHPERTPEQIEVAEQQVLAWQRFQEAQAWLAKDKAPFYSLEQVDQMRADWEQIKLHDDIDRIERKIEAMRDQGTVSCENCGHDTPVAIDDIKGFQEQLEILAQQISGDRPENPPLNETELDREHERIDAYEALHDEREKMKAVPEAEDPGFTMGDVERWKAQLADAEKIAELEQHIGALEEELEGLPDRSKELEDRKRYEWALEYYKKERAAYDEYMAKRAEYERIVEQYNGADDRLEALDRLLLSCRDYEKAFMRYETDRTHYDEQKAKLDASRHTAEQYKKAREALKELKVRVKTHLVPSLNRVASILLSRMTGGQRSHVHIDEDFNIHVDGQPLNTLSGSGKAVANLAIRVGLGQVLTHRVFSVFLGDELDASMDADRAGHTAEAMSGLTEQIDQVVVVSHKEHEADHYIQLA